MPILVDNYTWRQTPDKVIIRVPLQGVNCSKADVFTSSSYLKVHFPPFLFEVFLSTPIKESESKYTLIEHEIIFELQKLDSTTWSSLEAHLTKSEKQNLRLRIIEQMQMDAIKYAEKKSAKNTELHRQAVREQIAIDSQIQQHIANVKEYEKQKAMNELEEWKKKQQLENKIEILNQSTISTAKLNTKNTKILEPPVHRMPCRTSEEIFLEPMPLPRQTGTIHINFTSREFPTPSRESHMQEEEEWLKKQAEARRKIGFIPEDLTPEEQDPMWLKEKGDSFFHVGNYLGAISAYSYAIKIGSKMPALFSNRAAAHMVLGNLHKCIEDCSVALDLLTPPCSLNAVSRARCYARRGVALCKLGLMSEGISELRAALLLQPNDQKLMMDFEKAHALVDTPFNVEEDLELNL